MLLDEEEEKRRRGGEARTACKYMYMTVSDTKREGEIKSIEKTLGPAEIQTRDLLNTSQMLLHIQLKHPFMHA